MGAGVGSRRGRRDGAGADEAGKGALFRAALFFPRLNFFFFVKIKCTKKIKKNALFLLLSFLFSKFYTFMS